MKVRQQAMVGALVILLGGLLFASGMPLAFGAGEGAANAVEWAQAQPATPSTPASARFTTLLKAIKYTGLDTTLKGEGPFSVMAPTDAAFGKLGQDKLNALIQDKEQLTKVLKYHVVVGKKLTLKELVGMKTVATAEGGMLTFAATMSAAQGQGQQYTAASITGVTVNGVAHIVKWNIQLKNAIVQAIDTVLSPM